MKTVRYLAALLPMILVATTFAQDLPTPDLKLILKDLDLAATNSEGQITSRRKYANAQIQAASASGDAAETLYLLALQNTKYRQSPAAFYDWEHKNGELLYSPIFKAAAQLQMQYIDMGLARTDKNDAFAQIPVCQAYLNRLAAVKMQILLKSMEETASYGKHHNQGDSPHKIADESDNLLNESLKSCEVVNYFQIGDLLPGEKDFGSTPGDYEEILELNIRVPLREKNDQKVLAAWDQQIAYKSAMINATGDKQKASDFMQKTVPDLLFSKAKESVGIGQPNRGLTAVVDLIKHYPNNPSAKDWITFARGMISVGPTSPAPSASTNAPAAAPKTNSLAKP